MQGKQEELIRLLKRALSMEYGALWLLPRHMAQLADEELRRQLHLIAEVELEHAEKSAQMIHALGGVADADLPQLRSYTGVREILEAHLRGERESIALYEEALAITEDPDLHKALAHMKADEEGHQRLLERALARLPA